MNIYLLWGVLVAGGVGLGVAGLLVWQLVESSRARGKAEAQAEHRLEEAKDARAGGEIVAEERDPESTAGRLRDGSF